MRFQTPVRVLTLSLALAGAAGGAGATDVELPGDPSPWRVASDDTSGRTRTLELLRPGKSFGSSPEILVISRFPGDDASTAAEDYLSDKQGSCDDGHYEFEKSGWEDTIYTWDPRGCDFPEAELDEVGRFFVDGNSVIRISLRLRDGRRYATWSRWISSSNAAYDSWSGSVFESGSRRSASKAQDAPSSDICDDDDLDCLLAVQRQQVEALNSTRGGAGGDGSGSRRSGGSSSRSSSDGCCSASEIRSLHLQKGHPNSGLEDDTTRFRSTDTYIYAVARLRGDQGGSTVGFRWVKIDADGDEHEVTSYDAPIEHGNTWVYGSLYYTGLTPTGRYRVEIYFDGAYAGSRELEVVAGSSFG